MKTKFFIILTMLFMFCLPMEAQHRHRPEHRPHRQVEYHRPNGHIHGPLDCSGYYAYRNRYLYVPYEYDYMKIIENRILYKSYILNSIPCVVNLYKDNNNTYLYYYNEYGYRFACAIITISDCPYTRTCDIIVESPKFYKYVSEHIIKDLHTNYGIKDFRTYI